MAENETGVRKTRKKKKSENNIVTVLLAEDHTIVREGIRVLLEAQGDIEIVGEATNGKEAVAMTKELDPDLVIMDIAMPLLNGLEATRQIRQALPDVKVLILSAHSDDCLRRPRDGSGGGGIPDQADLRPLSVRCDTGSPEGKHLFQPGHRQALPQTASGFAG